MTNLKEDPGEPVKPEVALVQKVISEQQIQIQNGENTSCSGSSDDSDNTNGASSGSGVKTSSVSSSCSSVASSGTTSKLALRMADQVSLSSSPAEKRFKFEPNEDYLDQLLAMGISINGAKKALYYTGNRNVASATNWIFDHPELDLETPLEEEIKRLRAEELEDDCLEEEEDEDDSEEEALMAMHYRQHHQRQQHLNVYKNGSSHDHEHDHDHQCPHGTCDEDEEDLEEDDIDDEDDEHKMNG